MPTVTRRLLAAGVFAVIAIAAAVFVAIPTHAQVGRTATCVGRGSLVSFGPNAPDQLQTWMNQQIARGKTEFVVVDQNNVVCAW